MIILFFYLQDQKIFYVLFFELFHNFSRRRISSCILKIACWISRILNLKR